MGILTGCASHSSRPSLLGTAAPPVRLQVPFFSNQTDQCGPAALASLLRFWKIPSDPESLKKEMYLSPLKGTLPIDVLIAAKNHGLDATIENTSLSKIKSELQKGHPVIAYIDLGNRFFPRGHYVVVTGFDESRQGLYAHSARTPNAFFTYERFLKAWVKTDQWALVAVGLNAH